MKANHRPNRRRKSGFTLIEILLVVVIIGILAGIALPKLSGHTRRAEITRARAEIENIGTALAQYEMDMGEFPRSLQELVTSPGSDRWNGPYLTKGLPNDPWRRPYVYVYPGQRNPRSYDLYSLGPDGVESADDIGNWVSDTATSP
ncbi:MAG: type II secretion system major pseudopilin GspG [Kiritimatiellae bacterium]|nr:type II secretion system major pseudopilin GspG [Kiritimatiellia bacterium]